MKKTRTDAMGSSRRDFLKLSASAAVGMGIAQPRDLKLIKVL